MGEREDDDQMCFPGAWRKGCLDRSSEVSGAACGAVWTLVRRCGDRSSVPGMNSMCASQQPGALLRRRLGQVPPGPCCHLSLVTSPGLAPSLQACLSVSPIAETLALTPEWVSGFSARPSSSPLLQTQLTPFPGNTWPGVSALRRNQAVMILDFECSAVCYDSGLVLWRSRLSLSPRCRHLIWAPV